MKFLNIHKVADGKYLKKYELTYENKAGNIKKYEIASRRELKNAEDLGKRVSGVSIVATKGEKLVLLNEFRMAVNRRIYNLIAGMIEEEESVEECIKREVYEETGLKVKQILHILPPSYSAVGISDTKTYIAFVEVDGELSDHSSENEDIRASFYSREEVASMLLTQEFSSRAQIIAYFFSKKEKKRNFAVDR